MPDAVTGVRIPLISLPWMWLRWSYRLARTISWRAIDSVLGVRTTPPLKPPRADYASELLPSLPSGWLQLLRVFWTLRPSPDDVLLDLGCGAGRAVLVAALLPFRRAIGVEINARMIEQAQRNARTFRSRHRAKIELLRANLNEFGLRDDVTVLFSYNTLNKESFERWMDSVLSSLDRAPRRLRLVYMNPVLHEVLIESGRWKLLRRFRGLRPTQRWARSLSTCVYEVRLVPIAARATSQAGADHSFA
jgi:SAM-dependent methyltransferase